MLSKTHYANGQRIWTLEGNLLTFYFKNGKVKAKGAYENEMMQGKWIFYRESGQLWSIGHFKDNLKHGSWIRYDKDDKLEYDETFVDGKVAKQK